MFFVVDNNVFFPLGKIPRGRNNLKWADYLSLDGFGGRCIHPSTPRRLLADIHPNCSDLITQADHDAYSSLASKPRIIKSADWKQSALSALNQLSSFAFRNMLEDNYSVYSTLRLYRPDTIAFQVPAKALLTLAAPGLFYMPSSQLYDNDRDLGDVSTYLTRASFDENRNDNGRFRSCNEIIVSNEKRLLY